METLGIEVRNIVSDLLDRNEECFYKKHITAINNFNKIATTAIANWWNKQDILVNNFNQISPDKVIPMWVREDHKNYIGLFNISEPDNVMRFEFIFDNDANTYTLRAYELKEETAIKVI